MRFCVPRISHYIVVMVLALTFHTKDPDGVGDAVNAVMFPDLSPAADFEAALLTLR